MSRLMCTPTLLATSSQVSGSALQIGQPMAVLGTSIGGAVAIDFALHHPEAVVKLCLVDAQGFIDGLGPMPKAPGCLTKFLVRKARHHKKSAVVGQWSALLEVLGFICQSALPGLVTNAVSLQVQRSEWLRQLAASVAYFDKKRFATKDNMRIRRLHTFCPGLLILCHVCPLATQPAIFGAALHTSLRLRAQAEFSAGWTEANQAFIRSGGYALSKRVREVQQECLVCWGRQDRILGPKYAKQFSDELPKSKLVWMEACGHLGHLEQPQMLADYVLDFLQVPRAAQVANQVPAPQT